MHLPYMEKGNLHAPICSSPQDGCLITSIIQIIHTNANKKTSWTRVHNLLMVMSHVK